MKYQDRLNLQQTINKLETNDFDYNDIKLILIDLREYSEHKSHFQELSHFVAHKDRNKGLVHSNVEGYFCNLYLEHLMRNMGYQWDYSKQPEPFVGVSVLFCAEMKPKDFYKKHNIQKEKFIKQVKQNLPIEPKSKFQWSDSQKFCEIINDLMSTLTIKPLFNSVELIESFFYELKRNRFQFNREKVNKNRLMLIIMVLLHETVYFSPILRRKIGKLLINLSKLDNDKKIIQVSSVLDPFTVEEDILGIKHIRSLQYTLPLVTSDLLAEDWCTHALINHLEDSSFDKKEGNIFLNGDSKLDIYYNS